ncbi:MAG TPA: chromate resistance protein ChrB domain-containing protein [Thermoanaerobaculia bacterium]|nr:chromate resistance protein ChrB domain-containing protein [Thermoanaerobaculia bacterium]
MPWIGLSYSLPAGSASTRRVAVWRRLRQLGAQAPAGSLSMLPASDESLEAFNWLAEEIESAGGEAIVLRVERLEGDAEAHLVAAFREARNEDYRQLAAECDEVAREAAASVANGAAGRARLEELRRRLAEIVRADVFQASAHSEAAAALAKLEAALRGDRGKSGKTPRVPPADPAAYRGRRWVTRPRPHVDRLASAWLIRRFIDPEARIRYGETARQGEVSFDMRGAEFGHRGGLCTFETLLAAFSLGSDSADPALAALAEIVHEIDLGDGTSARPEIAGLDGVLRGWLAAGWSDAELERAGIALFEGLYGSLANDAPKKKAKKETKKQAHREEKKPKRARRSSAR